LKKTDQDQLLKQFKQSENTDVAEAAKNHIVHNSPEHEAGRIKRLEKLIKKRI